MKQLIPLPSRPAVGSPVKLLARLDCRHFSHKLQFGCRVAGKDRLGSESVYPALGRGWHWMKLGDS